MLPERPHDPIEIVRVKVLLPIGVEELESLVDAIDVEGRLQGLLEHVTELVVFHFPVDRLHARPEVAPLGVGRGHAERS